jgi:hypothetical protein
MRAPWGTWHLEAFECSLLTDAMDFHLTQRLAMGAELRRLMHGWMAS